MLELRAILADRRLHRLGWSGAAVGACCLLLAWRMGFDSSDVKSGWMTLEKWLQQHPIWLFASLVVLPGFPFPTSALLILAGTVWRDRPLTGLVICLIALSLNMTWTYWFARITGRKGINRWLVPLKMRLPDEGGGQGWRWMLVIRLTPGIPFFIQNFLSGVMKIPFGTYLPISVCCNGVLAGGLIFVGAGLASGSVTTLLGGGGLIAVVALLFQGLINRRV